MNLSLIIEEMRKYSDPSPVVVFDSVFQTLIATVLSQRTRDKNTEKAAKQLFAKYADAKAIAKAPIWDVEKLVKPAGFYKVKARRIRQISRRVAEEYNGIVPCDKEQLISLAGVGPKTAACVMVYGFKEPDLPVDTHVFRISNRLGLVQAKTTEDTESGLKKIIPRKYWIELNHLMVRYGQKICLQRRPKCNICKLRKICKYCTAKQL